MRGGGRGRNEYVRLEIRFGVLLLRALDLPSHNVLPDIVLLRQVEEPSDFGRPLGTKALGEGDIRQPGNIIITLLDNNHRQNGNVRANDASADRLALALASPSNTIAGMAVRKEKADTEWDQDTLFHRETLFVVATGNAEDVTLPLVTDWVGGDFLGDPLVIEDAAGSLIRYERYFDMRSKHTISSHRRYQ